MRKLYLGLSFITVTVLVACDDNSNSTKGSEPVEVADIMAEAFDDLPVCTEKRDGVMAYVKIEKIAYTCINGYWTPDSDDKDSSSSVTQDKEPESSNEEIDDIESSSSEEMSKFSSSSENVEFVDPSTIVKGTMTDDRDGRTYRTVKIGNQVWMAENLNYRYLGPTDDLDSSSFCYRNIFADCNTYGRLYLWSAAMDSAGIIEGNTPNSCGVNSECSPSGIVRGICPQGWHLPTQAEWNTLFTAVGGNSKAGSKLKSTSGWNDYDGESAHGTDVYGFSAIAAGFREGSGLFYGAGSCTRFWSATEDEYASFVSSMNPSYGYGGGANLAGVGKYDAISVRCLKD